MLGVTTLKGRWNLGSPLNRFLSFSTTATAIAPASTPDPAPLRPLLVVLLGAPLELRAFAAALLKGQLATYLRSFVDVLAGGGLGTIAEQLIVLARARRGIAGREPQIAAAWSAFGAVVALVAAERTELDRLALGPLAALASMRAIGLDYRERETPWLSPRSPMPQPCG